MCTTSAAIRARRKAKFDPRYQGWRKDAQTRAKHLQAKVQAATQRSQRKKG